MISHRARLPRAASCCGLAFALALVQLPAAAQGTPNKPAPAPAQGAPERPWPESPAKEADPPLIPAPNRDRAPTSTSGTEIAPPEGDRLLPPTPAAVTPAAPLESNATDAAHIRALEARVAANEARFQQLENEQKFWRHLKIGGYVQPQLLVTSYNANASPNRIDGVLPPGISANDVIARPDGTTTNGDYFRLRRTRLRVTYETSAMAMKLEIDPFPLGGTGPGIGTVVRDAEAVGIARWTKDVRTEFSAGVFLLPVRLELLESSRVRPFIERSYLVTALFPNGRDLGIHARTLAMKDRLFFDIGLVNGQSIDEPHFVAVPDLDRGKDFFAHLKYRFGFLTAGGSGYVGRGQNIDTQALRVKNFTRWMLNYEISAHYPLLRRLGETLVTSELTFTQNMDTGLVYPFALPAIPANFSDKVKNLTGRGFYVRVEQELTRLGLVGYRFDSYTPDASIATNLRDTHAFLATLRFSEHLRWMNEFDVVVDNIHATGTKPPSKHMLQFSSVLQAMY